MLAGTRWLTGAMVLATLAPLDSALDAQTRASCGTGNRLWRTAVGATLGSWGGLVAMKIRYSDWNEASASPSGIRGRNRGIVIGAVVGASLGNLRFGAPCRTSSAVPAPRTLAHRPISTEEIQAAGISGTVYDLVFARRRQWLNTRGVELSETPRVTLGERSATVTPADNPILVVYLDNVKVGDQAQLRNIPLDGVMEVKFYDASQATWRWGAGHNHGAIQVLTVTDDVKP
jgi:hypothetical protein